MARTHQKNLLILMILMLLCPMLIYGEGTVAIKDDMNFLTESDMISLQEIISRIVAERTLDIAVVITDQMEGKTSMVYADDYYDYNGYGLDSQKSGLMLLINMADREIWISTTGRAIDYFTDARIQEMVSNITEPLKSGEYYVAVNTFLDDVAYYASEDIPAGQHRVEQASVYYNETTTYGQRALGLVTNPLVYLFALIISGLATFLVTKLNGGKNTTNFKTYELDGSFDLRRSEDTYLREHLTRTKVVKINTTSSTHSGSSGTSHGGGGGRF